MAQWCAWCGHNKVPSKMRAGGKPSCPPCAVTVHQLNVNDPKNLPEVQQALRELADADEVWDRAEQ